MPRVNDEYIEGVNGTLRDVQHQLPRVMLGFDPNTTGWPGPAPWPLGAMAVLSGSQNYPVGWNLSGRIRWQGEGLNHAFETEMRRIDKFTFNVGVFLEATDETELENISAQEFQSYLPGDGPDTT